MDKYQTCILIVTVVIFSLLIYSYNNNLKNKIEHFTALVGIESPLTTYDDYGPSGLIYDMDDVKLPCYKFINDAIFPTKRITNNLDFDADSFFYYQNNPVRRELVPSNYADSGTLRNVNDRLNNETDAPQPSNFYFE